MTPAGINDELRPILRMTMPRGVEGESIEDVPIGETLGRSWILLGRIIPVDYDDLRLEEIEPGRRFQERSRTSTFRVWSHERTVEAVGDRAITDRLDWELKPLPARLPGVNRLAPAIVGFLFRHRHRRLQRHWGS